MGQARLKNYSSPGISPPRNILTKPAHRRRPRVLFLSYSRDDERVALRLANDLRGGGAALWHHPRVPLDSPPGWQFTL
jgi:hypothetical protein